MITFESRGSFKKTEDFLKSLSDGSIYKALERYGKEGVTALANATPVSSGLSASSWYYEIKKNGGRWSIGFYNSHRIPGGPPVVILLQYGHGTGTGGYVPGYDFINPAIQPIFDKISNEVWKAVKSA